MYAFHEKHCDKPKNFTVDHFEAKGVPRSTLFDILKRKENGISSERQSGRGRPAKIMTKSGIKRLVKLFDHKCGISQLKPARKMKWSQFIINWALKNKTSIRKRKKSKTPKRNDAHKVKIRPMCRQSYLKYKDLF